jgi:hypothetical protein
LYSIPNARLVSAELILEHVGGPTPLTLSNYSNKCKKERAEKMTQPAYKCWHFLGQIK